MLSLNAESAPPCDVSVRMLTIIIPIRWSPDRSDVEERLSYVLLDDMRPDAVDILVVDDGSEPALAKRLEAACLRLGFQYTRIESEASVFSIGRARNHGAQAARTPFILFQDADLLPYPGFYKELLVEIEVQQLAKYSERFLMIGAIYLTPNATQEYFSTCKEHRRSRFIQSLLDADKTRIEKFSTGTSTTVWSRHYFLAAGGNDPDFEGWGFEDIEFMCRALRRDKKFALPAEFSLDYKNFQSICEYRGWKSVYRLYGDMTFQKGLVLFHAWHPVESSGAYVKAKERNRKLFEKKLRAFAEKGEEPDPLPMPERGASLIFRANPWVYNRWLAPYLGQVIMVDEDILDVAGISQFLRDRRIDRVVFHNPYANEKMLAIYEWVKSHGVDFLVCERGALPGSVFFDPKGFNGESASYSPERWNRPLTAIESSSVSEYLRTLKATGEVLEDQPDRIGPQALRKALRISPGAKILFVPLQRPSDTVIKYLCGPIGSYDNFLALVRRLTHCLPPDWVVVVKRHPLETESPSLPGVLFADDAHIDDLVEAAEAVLLINSGVGVTGLIHGKPVLHAGTAFYGHAGLARQVANHEDVLDAIHTFRPDPELVTRFLHFLVFEFYTFARFRTRRVAWTDGALMTATTQIDYLTLRLPQLPEVCMQHRETVATPTDSILFDRYRGPDGKVVSLVPGSAGNGSAKSAPAVHAKAVPAAPLQAGISQAPESTAMRSPRSSSWTRKWTKFRTNPVMFLRDSKHSMLRAIGHAIQVH